MKNKNRILTESQKRQITENKEKAILESFASTFNKIKRINEDEVPETGQKKKLVVLVGPPSVGKSTWTESNFPNAYIINRDDIVEKVASKYSWTYDDMFATPPAEAKAGEVDEKYGNVIDSPEWMTWANTVFDKVLTANGEVQNIFTQRVSGAHPSGQDVVVDMTNMNAGSRKGALKAIEGNEDEYTTVAVDFKFEGAQELIKKMAAKRAEAAKRMGKSKTIPPQAFDRMFTSYEAPSNAEGFDEIISVDNIGNLKKALNDKDSVTEDKMSDGDSSNGLNIEHFEIEIDQDGYGAFTLPTRVIGTVNGQDFEFESFMTYNIPYNFQSVTDLVEEIIEVGGELTVNDEEVDNDEMREAITPLIVQKYGESLNALIQEISKFTERY